MKFSPALLAAAALAAALPQAHAALVFDANVTNNVITGTGIGNGGFTVDTTSGVEVGLRARVRYPSPTGVTNSNGDGTYNHAAGGFTSGGLPGGTRAAWNFDWSINTGTANVNAYTYRLGIDYDRSFGTNYLTFDLINSVNPNPAAGGLALWDHSFGNNTTAQSDGIEATGGTLAAALASYQALAAGNNLVQNSWNLDFFDDATYTFDPAANGNYSIFLEVIGASGVVARSDIEVIVGTGFVPEPASLALVGLALAGLGASRRRRA